jgi:hypothetical protein
MKQSHHRDVHFPSEQVPVCTGTPRLPVAAEDLCFSSLLREMKPEPPLPFTESCLLILLDALNPSLRPLDTFAAWYFLSEPLTRR